MSLIKRRLSEAELEDVVRRHSHHPPKDQIVAEKHAVARQAMIEATRQMLEVLPERSRETSMFLTKMDEARMWANAAIAMNQ